MNYLDIIILSLVGVSAFFGFKNGFIMEVSSLLGLLLGLFAASKLSKWFAHFLEKSVSPAFVEVVSFLIIFLFVVVLVMILAKIVNSFVDALALGLVNRLLGVLFAAIKGFIIVSVFLSAIDFISVSDPIISEKTQQESFLYKPLHKVTETVLPFLKFENIKEEISDTINF